MGRFAGLLGNCEDYFTFAKPALEHPRLERHVKDGVVFLGSGGHGCAYRTAQGAVLKLAFGGVRGDYDAAVAIKKGRLSGPHFPQIFDHGELRITKTTSMVLFVVREDLDDVQSRPVRDVLNNMPADGVVDDRDAWKDWENVLPSYVLPRLGANPKLTAAEIEQVKAVGRVLFKAARDGAAMPFDLYSENFGVRADGTIVVRDFSCWEFD